MGEILRFVHLLATAAKSIAGEELAGLYEQIRHHRWFNRIWWGMVICFLAGPAVWASTLVTWFLVGDPDMRSVMALASAWTAFIGGALFWTFTAPLGILLEAAATGTLKPAKVGVAYVRHGRRFLLTMGSLSIALVAIPAEKSMFMFLLFLAAIGICYLAERSAWINKAFNAYIFAAVIFSLLSLVSPINAKYIQEKVGNFADAPILQNYFEPGSSSASSSSATNTAQECIVLRPGMDQRVDNPGCYVIATTSDGVGPWVAVNSARLWTKICRPLPGEAFQLEFPDTSRIMVLPIPGDIPGQAHFRVRALNPYYRVLFFTSAVGDPADCTNTPPSA